MKPKNYPIQGLFYNYITTQYSPQTQYFLTVLALFENMYQLSEANICVIFA